MLDAKQGLEGVVDEVRCSAQLMVLRVGVADAAAKANSRKHQAGS